MDIIFNWCVDVLIFLATQLGITYKEVNVWVFCIIEPIVFLCMLVIIIKQHISIKNLNKDYGCNERNSTINS